MLLLNALQSAPTTRLFDFIGSLRTGTIGQARNTQLSINEVVRVEEPYLDTGLYLRTSNRYRWILIPRKLDGYEAIKRDLAVAGAGMMKKVIPSNWEEFLFVLLFMARYSAQQWSTTQGYCLPTSLSQPSSQSPGF